MFNFYKKFLLRVGPLRKLIKANTDFMEKSFSDHKTQFDIQAKELIIAKLTAAKANQENELISAQLIQMQDELEVFFLKKVELDELVKKIDLERLTATSALQEHKTLLNNLNNELKITNESLFNLRSQLYIKEKELDLVKFELDSYISAPKFVNESEEKYLKENELLSKQLMQAQEELESSNLEKVKFEELYRADQLRWERFKTRNPKYLDYESITLEDHSNISEIPYIKWTVKDLNQGKIEYDLLIFQTSLHDGCPGISMIKDAESSAQIENALILNQSLAGDSLKLYQRLSHSEFCQIKAAINILMQSELMNWAGVGLPKDFDLHFWREGLRSLCTRFNELPTRLRFDEIKLKRELINPDYEHLWFEFIGMSFGNRSWQKFELRLAASMIEKEHFSRFPKFEIPLIDGVSKPFDSWYAESRDDNGPKLELRFALEKGVFDSRVLAKLDAIDKAFILNIIYAMPDVLLRLKAEHVVIHRTWETWINFAKSCTQIIDNVRLRAINDSKKILTTSDSLSTAELPLSERKRVIVKTKSQISVASQEGVKEKLPKKLVTVKRPAIKNKKQK